MQNRVSAALASLPQAVQVQGVNVQKKSTAILQIVTLTSPDGQLRQPLSQQLRDHPPEGRDRAPARRRQRQRVRRRPVFDAHLARPGQDAGARPDAAGRRSRRCSSRAQQVDRRPDRRAAGARRPVVPVHARRVEPPRRSRAVRRRHRQDRRRAARSRGCATSAASSSARRPTARSSSSTASRRPASRSSSRRAPMRSTSPSEVDAKMDGAGARSSRKA